MYIHVCVFTNYNYTIIRFTHPRLGNWNECSFVKHSLSRNWKPWSYAWDFNNKSHLTIITSIKFNKHIESGPPSPCKLRFEMKLRSTAQTYVGYTINHAYSIFGIHLCQVGSKSFYRCKKYGVDTILYQHVDGQWWCYLINLS